MATIPQERVKSQNFTSYQEDGNKIVISGISDLYPNSHNVMELSEILYNKYSEYAAQNVPNRSLSFAPIGIAAFELLCPNVPRSPPPWEQSGKEATVTTDVIYRHKMTGAVKPITIEEEYKKNPDISPEDIKKLREWLKTQPHLPGDYLTDVDLLIVYHCCEKSQEVAKQVLDLHFTLRTMFTQYFKDRSFDKNAAFALNTVLYAPLPTPTPQGDRVIYLRLLDPDPRNFNILEVARAFMMVFDLWQYEEGTFSGFVIMIDMDQSVVGHVTRLDLMVIKKIVYFLQECMLTKLTGIHFMNAPYFMDKLLMLLKPFLSKKLLDMIHVHQTGSQELYDLIPQDILPKEEGGKYKDHITLRDELLQRLEANTAFFRDENKRRVNESLRPAGKPSAVVEEFGMQGSFKKLDID